jgi:cytochrome c biogenesis protein CcmG, thiol:disulfide interchange protein DsbE
VFVVTEAGDCADQLDVLDRVAARFPDVGFAAVAVREDLDDLQRRLRERRWRVPLGYDHDGAAATLYGLGAVCPLFTFADGSVAGTHVGVLDERELAERVEQLRAGRQLP